MRYLLALDQGTTSSRAILFDETGRQHAVAQREFTQHYPQPGYVEHDPREIWETQLATARAALAGIDVAQVAAIGITNQRETTLLWDRATGEPLHRAIVWQDRRTADICSRWKNDAFRVIQRASGLICDAYFSASKLFWLLENIPGARQRALRGELAFGTVDSWLLWNLTQGLVHATDVSNASRTMLYNINTCQWDPELLALANVPPAVLPQVLDSATVYGETHPALFGRPIPIAGIAGDQQAALFGQNCFTKGLAKNTYGTGCFLLSNLGDTPTISPHQLLTTIAWRRGGEITYALEGSVFVGGAVVQWLRDGLGIIQDAGEIEALARSVPDSGGVFLVPAFAGLGAPHWDQYARGTITGITRGTTRAHFARAALEAIAFQVADLLEVFQADAHQPLTELRVDGGAARNDLLLQFQADLLRVPVIRPQVTETTALGAAFLAGLGVGLWKSEQELTTAWKAEKTFEPQLSEQQALARRERWAEALRRAMEWEKPAGK